MANRKIIASARNGTPVVQTVASHCTVLLIIQFLIEFLNILLYKSFDSFL
jgi:hypothetical protein